MTFINHQHKITTLNGDNNYSVIDNMFCQKCGNENPETNQFCGKCGETLVKISQPDQKMASKEARIEQVKNKIAESKKEVEAYSETPYVIALLIGAFLMFGGFIGNIPFLLVLGVAIFGASIGLSSNAYGNKKKLEDAIFNYEGELHNLEKEP